jgi:hypothetical protein
VNKAGEFIEIEKWQRIEFPELGVVLGEGAQFHFNFYLFINIYKFVNIYEPDICF